MTQLGRYALIIKQSLDSYGIVQDIIYRLKGETASCDPVDTHLFVRAMKVKKR